jgi:hypothetical protein
MSPQVSANGSPATARALRVRRADHALRLLAAASGRHGADGGEGGGEPQRPLHEPVVHKGDLLPPTRRSG